MTDHATAYRIATDNRRRAADLLAGLTPEQWRTPSLCVGWTVREVAAHLVEPLESGMTTLGLLGALVRHRGSLDRMVDVHARRAASRPTDELVARLRELSGAELDPSVIGPRGPMVDSLIHLRDMARPLGAAVDAPPEDWRHALDFVATPTSVTRSFAPRKRLAGLRLVATDQDWAKGDGAELRGPSEALVMAVTGRTVALADLTGPGVDVLRGRLSGS
ncbi:maleylpyruvate isomerase family mycothiol-dependent enzyme [Nocardioides marinquilinus]|uniref:Maleylpyruvate isomerase family mycothiol-dependent enzyme n=1 Tax=Nocardioides marinquilinus TaxID=1210400 RepID=A0ABP9PBN5_9ACTN